MTVVDPAPVTKTSVHVLHIQLDSAVCFHAQHMCWLLLAVHHAQVVYVGSSSCRPGRVQE
jgi:hypothetical protein